MSEIINGANIVCEFSQGKILKMIDDQLAMAEEHKAIVEHGICYMLSLEWLRCAIGGSKDLAHFLNLGDDHKVKPKFDTVACAYFKQVANNFIAYSDRLKNQFRVSAVDFLKDIVTLPSGITYPEIDNYFADLCSGKRINFDKAESTGNADLFNRVLTGQGDRMFFLRLVLTEGGHRIAFINKGDTLNLFDPNYGVYKVDDAKMLFTSLDSIYGGIVSSYASSCPL